MQSPPESQPSSPAAPWVNILGSRHLADWLAQERVSLAMTTYQAGKLLLLGRQPNGRLGVHERTFDRCMGLWGDGQVLWMSTEYQIWRLENSLAAGESYQDHDRLYIPRTGYTTGDLDVHDLAVESDGRLVFANTRFGCLATLSDHCSFRPLWRPPFLSRLAPEDRCHLNGLAVVAGRAKYMTAVSRSDVCDGWRDRRRDGGCVLDIETNDLVATGLSMPHSPRYYRERLWVLNSGAGQFGYVDLQKGQFEPVAFCPGYLRGLAFIGDYALVGLSRPRHDHTFSGLELDQQLASRQAEAQCGVQIIDLRSGDIVHWLRVEGLITELYDIVALPEVVRPMALGFKSDEIKRILTIEQDRGIVR